MCRLRRVNNSACTLLFPHNNDGQMKGLYWLIAVLIALGGYFAGRWLYFKPKFDEGHMAPDFTAELMTGDTFSLAGLRGQYVLLDFWGSWCGPCRRENAVLVQLHERYRSEPFTIVSIGIESSRDRWKRAIEHDQLSWKYHIVQLDNFKSPIARKYGVRELPTKYLIDPAGEIVAVNPGMVELDEFLSERL